MTTALPGRAALPAGAEDKLREFLGPGRLLGAVTRLPLKPLVHDHCDKFIALDARGEPAAFIVVSPPSHPGVVAAAAEHAHAARAALGERLGANVLVPYFVGAPEGRSYSITAYCPPLSLRRLIGRWQRWRLAPRLLRWLEEAVAATRAPVAPDALEATLLAPLRAVAENGRVDPAIRAVAAASIADALAGRWRPCTVVSHNDLWWGNFVRGRPPLNPAAPFYVVDWGGATTHGMPIYDLVRLAMSLELSPRRLREALHRHAAVLGCRPSHDLLGYLLAAFGTFSFELGEWPEDRFLDALHLCSRLTLRALGA